MVTRQVQAEATHLLADPRLSVLISRKRRVSDLGPNIPNLLYLLVLEAALLLALVYNLGRWSLYAWRRDLRGEAYISPLGVYRPDGCQPLRGFTRRPLSVTVEPGNPAVLAFFCRTTTPAGLAPIQVTIQIRVPVPVGREDEARACLPGALDQHWPRVRRMPCSK